MHILKILFAVFICFGAHFIYGSTNSANTKETPPLVLIYNELSIVSRITNAIALQAGSIEKTLNIRDVITELLKTHAKSFTKLVNHDPEKLIPIMNHLFNSSSKVFPGNKAARKAEKEKLRDIQQLNLDLSKGLELTDVDVAEVDKSLKVINEQDFKDTVMVCNSEVIMTIQNFVKSMGGSKIVLTNTERRNYPRKFKSKMNQVKGCLKSIKDYGKVTGTLFQELESLRQLKYLREIITYFNEHYGNFTNFTKSISFLQKHFAKAKSIWKSGNLSDTFIAIGDQLDQITNPKNQPKPTLCAGLPGDDDVAVVADDVKSGWFKEKVAMGKSTEELEKALEPFNKFGRKMENLRKSWKDFNEEFHSRKSRKYVMTLSRRFKDYEKYTGLETGEKLLKKSYESFQMCWKGGSSNLNETTDLKDFDSKFEDLKKVDEKFRDIRKWCNETVHLLDFKILEHSLDAYQKLDLKNSGLNDMNQNIKSLPHFGTLISFLERFEKLEKYRNSFKSHLKIVNEDRELKNIFKKGIETMSKSQINKNLKCLNLNLKSKNQYQSIQFDELCQFLDAVLTFTFDKREKKIMRYLNVLSNLRKNLFKVEKFVEQLGTTKSPIVTNFKDSMGLSTRFGRGMLLLRNMAGALSLKSALLDATSYEKEVNDQIIQHDNEHPNVQTFWRGNRKAAILKLIEDLEKLNEHSKQFVSKDLLTLGETLKAATKVPGLHGFGQGFLGIFEKLKSYKNNTIFHEAINNSEKLAHLYLDFAAHKGHLNAAFLSMDNIKGQFDEMFGLNAKEKRIRHAYLIVVAIAVSILIVILIAALILYGLTEKGRTRYKNLYLFYFGKPKDFEKRWRYALFMDRKDGTNALIDAVREINPPNVLKEVKRGAYINVYNEFGNTPLHSATKLGYAEIVNILIRNGADQSLLNAENKTPEQMIPLKIRPEKVEKYEKIQQIYKKYQNKKFRIRVPEVFPVSSFHILIDKNTNDELTIQFMEKFPAITTTERLATSTHFIVETQPDGSLETDDLSVLVWILNGVIIVKDTWMSDCLKDEQLIGKDWEYLVEKVKYKGIEYDTIGQWTQAMAKGQMPFLYGVYVAVVMLEYPKLITLASIVTNLGGIMCPKFPNKSSFNIGSHPYLHANVGPIFIIHDGKLDLDVYKNDPDKMYTFFTEEQFISFLLKREINVDKSQNPIPVVSELEDD